ncbi:MAG: hypothetical protein JNJ69_12555 [Leptospiraceae bacterium]|nr:hypothetical protein [Leptospiraceae bacterium]
MPINGIKALQFIFSAALVVLWGGCGSDNANSAAAGSSSNGGCTPSLIGGRTTCPLNLTGEVTTVAGPAAGASTSGDTDATGNSARFNFPYHAVSDGAYVFLADLSNNKIRRFTISSGVVTTIAGPNAGTTTSGDTDNTGSAARFSMPRGVTSDGTNLYIADGFNNKIRKMVISSGVVTTIAGPAQGTTTSGDADGSANVARFNLPNAITTDGSNLYVADLNNHKIRKIEISSGNVTTLAGPAAGTIQQGDTDGTGTAARFNAPAGITNDGTYLYVTEGNSHKIRKITIATGAVTTLAGPAQGSSTSGDTDGSGNAARFNFPVGITTDGTSLFVTEANNNKIRRIK